MFDFRNAEALSWNFQSQLHTTFLGGSRRVRRLREVSVPSKILVGKPQRFLAPRSTIKEPVLLPRSHPQFPRHLKCTRPIQIINGRVDQPIVGTEKMNAGHTVLPELVHR